MNDFSEIEQELKKLRPLPPSAALFDAIQSKMNEAELAEKIIPLHRPQVNWLWLGTGLAAAAVVLIFARFQIQQPAAPKNVAAEKPAPVTIPAAEQARPETAATYSQPQFVPDGLTRVVYHTHDDGLLYASASDQPVRRLRSFGRDTQQWRNPVTGASLRVSYPSEQIELIPVSGQ